MGFCLAGRRGLTEQREEDSELEAYTAQVTNLTLCTVLWSVGPWRHRAFRQVIARNACGRLLYATILVASTLLLISTALQDIHLGSVILNN